MNLLSEIGLGAIPLGVESIGRRSKFVLATIVTLRNEGT